MRLAQNPIIFQSQAPRRLYDNDVSIVHPPETVVGRYFPIRRFITAVESGSLYFRRLDSFLDQLEGQPTQSLYEVEGDSMLQWYESNRRFAFVSCWNLDDGESNEMWNFYAQNEGVLLLSTVSQLTAAFNTATDDAGEIDGFNVGEVRYDDEINSVHELISRPLSNLGPIFGKRRVYAWENEYRIVMRPGSVTSEFLDSDANENYDRQGVLLPVRFGNLINSLVWRGASQTELPALLDAHNLGHVPVHQSNHQ